MTGRASDPVDVAEHRAEVELGQASILLLGHFQQRIQPVAGPVQDDIQVYS